MLRSIALTMLACGLAAAYDAMPAHGADPGAGKTWTPAACPPPPEATRGPSSLKITGPCAFEHRGIAECEIANDDYNG